MKYKKHDPITYSRFIYLITEFSILEDLLHYFKNEELTKIDRNRDKLEPYIVEQIKYCNRYQRGIRGHLKECKEWDTFPEAFWDETHISQHQANPSISEAFPSDDNFSSKLKYIVHEIQRVMKIEDKCLTDYQYSGYIDHQPVAIDFLDYLIDIYGQLYDAYAYFNKILHDSSIQLSIY